MEDKKKKVEVTPYIQYYTYFSKKDIHEFTEKEELDPTIQV